MKMRNPVVVVYTEGGFYKPYSGKPAAIRFYGDRTIEDDFIPPDCKRKRLSRREWRNIRRLARADEAALRLEIEADRALLLLGAL
ncbi:MAG: hypothetical protein ACK5PF_11325 [bacterium]